MRWRASSTMLGRNPLASARRGQRGCVGVATTPRGSRLSRPVLLTSLMPRLLLESLHTFQRGVAESRPHAARMNTPAPRILVLVACLQVFASAGFAQAV